MPHNYIKMSDKFFVFFMSPYFVYVTAFDGRVKFVQGFNFATFRKLVYNFYSICLLQFSKTSFLSFLIFNISVHDIDQNS